MRRRNNMHEIAKKQILHLFEQAKIQFFSDPRLSNRYVLIARKIAMKARMHIPQEVKRQYCKHCLAFLYPPYNFRVRLQKRHVARTCLTCKKTMRIPYVNEQKARRKAI